MTIEEITAAPELPEPAENDDDFVPGPLDEEDAEAFEGTPEEEDLLQDADDADPLAPLKPPFVDS